MSALARAARRFRHRATHARNKGGAQRLRGLADQLLTVVRDLEQGGAL